MQDHISDRRSEPRFFVGAPAILRRPNGDEAFPAVTLNVSAGGLLIEVAGGHPFLVGEPLVCELALPDRPEQPFASWGIGRVVRVDHAEAAIELEAATFAPLDGQC
jgi:PilZ domain-containing protein